MTSSNFEESVILTKNNLIGPKGIPINKKEDAWISGLLAERFKIINSGRKVLSFGSYSDAEKPR